MSEIPEPTKEDAVALEAMYDCLAFGPPQSESAMSLIDWRFRLLHHYRQRCEELEKHAPDVASLLSDQSATIASLEAELTESKLAYDALLEQTKESTLMDQIDSLMESVRTLEAENAELRDRDARVSKERGM